MTEIRIYIAGSDSLIEKSDKILDSVSDRYRQKYNELKTEQQRSGALAAALLLMFFAGIGAEDEVLCNEYGKPYLPGKPEFSISHSDDFAVLAVSGDQPVGVDIERIGRVTPRVIRKVSNMDAASSSELDLALEWTRVEARLKLKGTGFYADPLKYEGKSLFYSSCAYDGHCITCATASEHTVTVDRVDFKIEEDSISYTTENIIGKDIQT